MHGIYMYTYNQRRLSCWEVSHLLRRRAAPRQPFAMRQQQAQPAVSQPPSGLGMPRSVLPQELSALCELPLAEWLAAVGLPQHLLAQLLEATIHAAWRPTQLTCQLALTQALVHHAA